MHRYYNSSKMQEKQYNRRNAATRRKKLHRKENYKKIKTKVQNLTSLQKKKYVVIPFLE